MPSANEPQRGPVGRDRESADAAGGAVKVAPQDATLVRKDAARVVRDPTLTYRQRVQQLAMVAENALPRPAASAACHAALDERVICDMFEGNAPYRPRYVLPDYAKALRNGSPYLELPPPEDLNEALWFLASMYASVPSITGYPVYLGDLDALLAPFATGMSAEALVPALRPFWRALDRMVPDAFAHANLGPRDTPVLRAILRLERDLKQIVPNLSLKVDAHTPDDLLIDAVETVFACAKPHFVHHEMMTADHGEGYAAVSCYNALRIGGGAHTLPRLNLAEAARRHEGSSEAFFETTLPRYVELTAELMEARIRFLVEDARFYEHTWLVRDGLISLDRFSAMFGLFGLAEAVDELTRREGSDARYGHDDGANALGLRITRAVAAQVAARPMPYCDGFGGRAMLHAQSGIDSDVGVTAGTRIPIGDEPGLYEHLATVAPHHELFTAGVSDILHFDETAERNPEAIVDVIRGAFRSGMREFTFNVEGNEFIRITGYLVRKSDLAHVGTGARHASTILGAGNEEGAHCSQRASKRVIAAERQGGS
jgi:YjjI family glycine radical enzyme